MSLETAVTQQEAYGWRYGAREEAAADVGTILFVEDEAFVREVVCEVLRSAGYCVLMAKNAVEAVRTYDEHRGRIDLLLTDMVLPGENGRALASRLRREDPQLKVLLVTGYSEQMGLLEATQLECLAKPFSTEVLLRRVWKLLGGARVTVRPEELVTHAYGSV
jgi:CheY-like chemotaxis protein